MFPVKSKGVRDEDARGPCGSSGGGSVLIDTSRRSNPAVECRRSDDVQAAEPAAVRLL
jgi:hypothetical protein